MTTAKTKPKKKIKGFTWVTADIYKQSLFLSVGQTDMQLKNSLLKHVDPFQEKEANDVVDYLKRKHDRHNGLFAVVQGLHIIRIYEEADYFDHHFHGVLAHEILHATFELLTARGVTYSEDSEEAFTYLHDYYTSNLYKNIL
jgi:hypothetical protein